MKIILLADVKTLGKKGDIVDVSDGYARNFVLPKKLGLEATNQNMNDLKLKKASEAKEAQNLLDRAKALAAELETKQITLTMKAGEGGKSFGSIASKEIAQAYQEQCQVELDKKKILLSDPIKNFGVHEVAIKLHPQVVGKLKVNVKEA
ncbi:MAG: 50S ribosomal protein L9 [Lachnospiraceae bacterium]|jgi:large subunit ribosomal protein L9|nr:50S ribosomal protein L9 [Lachnospiraceae bacterium]